MERLRVRRAAYQCGLMTPSLATFPLLKDASAEVLRAAEAEAEWFSLPGGWPLFEAGEDSDGLYFVLSGAMAAFRRDAEGAQRLVGYIRAGEPLGEMALIAEEPHSAAAYAIRDCELVRLSPAAFDRLARGHPALMQALARVILDRTRQERRQRPRTDPKIFALIASSPTIDLRLRARTLQAGLAKLGKRACIVAEEGQTMRSAAFDALERDYDLVLLISPIADTVWFRMCLRQADRLWVLARADARPSLPLLPDDPSPARQFQLVDVVLLHHGGQRRAAGQEWRMAANAARLFHWNGLDDSDGARLARIMAGVSVGLVLSGGGARAYAHLGVVRALREANVPIDLVGGASMGAIVAACVAMGWSDQEIEDRIRRAFVASNPLGDYVLPVVALSAGERVGERLQEHFGEVLIEDLAAPFFCVSTDLIAGAQYTHRAGRLREALRATISLPGILPPVVAGANRLLVDGAVLNNFPVDIMRETHSGAILGVDVARREGIDIADFIDPPKFLRWVSLHGWQTAPPIASLLMRAATLTVDPWRGRERTDLLIAPEMPAIDLRDWKRFDAAVGAGYEAAVAALKAHPAFGALASNRAAPTPAWPAREALPLDAGE